MSQLSLSPASSSPRGATSPKSDTRGAPNEKETQSYFATESPSSAPTVASPSSVAAIDSPKENASYDEKKACLKKCLHQFVNTNHLSGDFHTIKDFNFGLIDEEDFWLYRNPSDGQNILHSLAKQRDNALQESILKLIPTKILWTLLQQKKREQSALTHSLSWCDPQVEKTPFQLPETTNNQLKGPPFADLLIKHGHLFALLSYFQSRPSAHMNSFELESFKGFLWYTNQLFANHPNNDFVGPPYCLDLLHLPDNSPGHTFLEQLHADFTKQQAQNPVEFNIKLKLFFDEITQTPFPLESERGSSQGRDCVYTLALILNPPKGEKTGPKCPSFPLSLQNFIEFLWAAPKKMPPPSMGEEERKKKKNILHMAAQKARPIDLKVVLGSLKEEDIGRLLQEKTAKGLKPFHWADKTRIVNKRSDFGTLVAEEAHFFPLFSYFQQKLRRGKEVVSRGTEDGEKFEEFLTFVTVAARYPEKLKDHELKPFSSGLHKTGEFSILMSDLKLSLMSLEPAKIKKLATNFIEKIKIDVQIFNCPAEKELLCEPFADILKKKDIDELNNFIENLFRNQSAFPVDKYFLKKLKIKHPLGILSRLQLKPFFPYSPVHFIIGRCPKELGPLFFQNIQPSELAKMAQQEVNAEGKVIFETLFTPQSAMRQATSSGTRDSVYRMLAGYSHLFLFLEYFIRKHSLGEKGFSPTVSSRFQNFLSYLEDECKGIHFLQTNLPLNDKSEYSALVAPVHNALLEKGPSALLMFKTKLEEMLANLRVAGREPADEDFKTEQVVTRILAALNKDPSVQVQKSPVEIRPRPDVKKLGQQVELTDIKGIESHPLG